MISKGRLYAEGKSTFAGLFIPNSTFDEQSLFAWKQYQNKKGMLYTDASKVEDNLNSQSFDVRSPWVTAIPMTDAANRVFFPEGSDGESSQIAIEALIKSKILVDDEHSSFRVYNTESPDGSGLNIVVERKGTNGVSYVVLNSDRINDINSKTLGIIDRARTWVQTEGE